MRKFFQVIGIIVFTLFVLGLFSIGSGISSLVGKDKKLGKDSILLLELDGVILDGKQFLKDLRKYRELDEIKGILVQVNSPGGVVGPSQEIYSELKKTREVFKKPVVISGSGLVASGAFYAAMGADKVITNPGTLMGSIGVIMEFANLSKLYEWAKIQRYVVKTGAYKDTGAEYREMRDDEKKLLATLMDDVLMQFKTAISQGRNMPMDKVTQYADGRIFTGKEAVELGFADQVGTLSDAIEVVGELSGLGKKPEIFEAPKEHGSVLEFLMDGAESKLAGSSLKLNPVESVKSTMKLMGQPLFILPGVWLE